MVTLAVVTLAVVTFSGAASSAAVGVTGAADWGSPASWDRESPVSMRSDWLCSASGVVTRPA